MRGEVYDVCCAECGKYLFTEHDDPKRFWRENDNGDYYYNDVKGVFLCTSCSHGLRASDDTDHFSTEPCEVILGEYMLL